MKKIKKAIFSGLGLMLLFSVLSATTVLAGDETYIQERQLELLQEFLDMTVNPRLRTAYDGVFTGGLWGTPLTPSGFSDYEDSFIIGVSDIDDMFNEDLKEVISLTTGIPVENITFLYVNLESFQRNEPRSLEEWMEVNPVRAAQILTIISRDPSYYGYTFEEVELFEGLLAERDLVKDSLAIEPRSFTVQMGNIVVIRSSAGWFEVTAGHPINMSVNSFFTACHGNSRTGDRVYLGSTHIGTTGAARHLPASAIDVTPVNLVGSHRINSVPPGGAPLWGMRVSAHPAAGTVVNSFGGMTGVINGSVVRYTGTQSFSGFRFSEMVMVSNTNNRLRIRGDSGAGVTHLNSAVGTHSFSGTVNLNGVWRNINFYSGSWRYN